MLYGMFSVLRELLLWLWRAELGADEGGVWRRRSGWMGGDAEQRGREGGSEGVGTAL